MLTNNRFETTELANRIDYEKTKILKLFKENGYEAEAEELIKELEFSSGNNKIRVVFIGQYTAGKSTIISALTGNNSIVIDSNIATSQTADYSWGGVILTDTPGLYTENRDHDEKTNNMIRQSDLLIYCITSDLFNQYTLEDFKKWAFEKKYVGKMFLVVNKMSKEDGEYNALCDSYSQSLNKSLSPHSIEEFSHSFVDAKDYRDGCRENDQELIEYSHFETFISELNGFIKRKGLLGKLDTPIMILKSSIDKVTQEVIEDDTSKAGVSLLNRIERKVEQQRIKVSIDARNIIRRGLRTITDKGYELSRQVGVEDIDFSEDDVNELVATACEAINRKLENLCDDAIQSLNKEIEEVLNSDTACYFFNSISGSYSEKIHFFENKKTKTNRKQFEAIKRAIENVSDKTVRMAVNNGGRTANLFIRASEASKSQLHKAVYDIGKQIGYNFKPWQAVNIAKNVGNVAKFAGPAIGVIGIVVDLKEAVNTQERIKAIEKAQIEYRESFVNIASGLESQYMDEISVLLSTYDDIIKKLQEDRNDRQGLARANDEINRKLLEIRNSLVDIQMELFK